MAARGREVILGEAYVTQRLQVVRRRWVVELYLCLDLPQQEDEKDYERLCASAEAFVYAAMTRLMMRRLTRV